jgi:hypothetical protein
MGQHHAPAALLPAKSPWYPLDWRLGGPQNKCGRRGVKKYLLVLCNSEVICERYWLLNASILDCICASFEVFKGKDVSQVFTRIFWSENSFTLLYQREYLNWLFRNAADHIMGTYTHNISHAR